MSNQEEPINTLHASVVDIVDPEYAKAYQYQVGRLRADQVPYEVYNADRPKYTFPTVKVAGPFPEVDSAIIYQVPVSQPPGEIRVQVYVPTSGDIAAGGLRRDGRLPAVVDFHGGGFVIGGLAADDSWCRQMCQTAGCIAINVEYRLSPEYPHPTPVMDSLDAYKWVLQNAERLGVDPSRMALSGLSAGGCIAAALALLIRDDITVPSKPVLQILVVPVIDARFVPEVEDTFDPSSAVYESYRTCQRAPMLPLARLVWFYNLWIGKGSVRTEKANDFRASPIVAKSHAGLAPASLHLAEVDPLRSEGEAYHAKLLKDGTPSKIKIYKGMGHTFAHWDGAVSGGAEFATTSAKELKEAFK